MSIQAMAWAIEQRVVSDATARHVLLVLANYADRDGKDAFPSVQRISEETGLSERSVRYKLDALEEAGVIVRGDQRLAAVKIDRADRRPIVYDIPGVRGAPDAPRKATGCSSRTNGVQTTTERGAPAAPNPSLTDKASDLSRAGDRDRTMTAAGEACRLMRDAGCVSTNPSHARLIEALRDGVTPQALADTVREGVDKQIDAQGLFAWAIATARGRVTDAGKTPAPRQPNGGRHAAANPRSAVDRVAANIATRRGGEFADADTIEGEVVAHR